MRDAAEAVEEIETESAAFNDMDFRRQAAVFRQAAQRKHPNCVICTHQVAKTQQSNAAWQSFTHRWPFTFRGPGPSALSSSMRRWGTNFQPVKMLSISPFFSALPTSTAL